MNNKYIYKQKNFAIDSSYGTLFNSSTIVDRLYNSSLYSH